MKTYIVDLPVIDGPMQEVAQFKTRQEAIEFCQKHIGTDANGCIDLISEIESGEEE